MRRARLALAWVSALFLFWPIADGWSAASWNVHTWGRLRALQRRAPDDALDREFRTVRPFLPEQGAIGFQKVGAQDDRRTWLRVQYALEPRRVLDSADAEFVVEVGPAEGQSSLRLVRGYAEVARLADDLRLYRRLRP